MSHVAFGAASSSCLPVSRVVALMPCLFMPFCVRMHNLRKDKRPK